MGNTGSTAGANRLAISAMSHVVKFSKDELLHLQREFSRLAAKDGNKFAISRAQFSEALALVGIKETDKEILDRMFTLLDDTGDDQVNFRSFVVGVAPLLRGSLVEKLNFAFELYDTDKTHTVSKAEMMEVFGHMNDAVSFFGDEKLSHDQVVAIVDKIFADYDHEHNGSLSYTEFMEAVAEHPILVKFVYGSAPEGDAAAAEDA
jgi:Ca2+-binding EF-hand superfamily protein